MSKLSLNPPNIINRRDAYENDRTYREAANLARVIKQLYVSIARAFNSVYEGDIASSGGATASRPAAPRLYQQYYDTTISKLVLWDGSNWVDSMGTIS